MSTPRIEGYELVNSTEGTDKLRMIREGERMLLNNSRVLFGSGLSDGNRHDPANPPMILADRAGVTIDPSRSIACPKDTPLRTAIVEIVRRLRSTFPLPARDERGEG